MGPGFLGEYYKDGGGDPAQFVNLHFFSPAEHPQRALVEVVQTAATPPEVLAALHGFVRKIGKVPVILQDGSPGFLVNAALAEYFREAEAIYREGLRHIAAGRDGTLEEVFGALTQSEDPAERARRLLG